MQLWSVGPSLIYAFWINGIFQMPIQLAGSLFMFCKLLFSLEWIRSKTKFFVIWLQLLFSFLFICILPLFTLLKSISDIFNPPLSLAPEDKDILLHLLRLEKENEEYEFHHQEEEEQPLHSKRNHRHHTKSATSPTVHNKVIFFGHKLSTEEDRKRFVDSIQLVFGRSLFSLVIGNNYEACAIQNTIYVPSIEPIDRETLFHEVRIYYVIVERGTLICIRLYIVYSFIIIMEDLLVL
jgi:hypothetical protein